MHDMWTPLNEHFRARGLVPVEALYSASLLGLVGWSVWQFVLVCPVVWTCVVVLLVIMSDSVESDSNFDLLGGSDSELKFEDSDAGEGCGQLPEIDAYVDLVSSSNDEVFLPASQHDQMMQFIDFQPLER